MEKSKIERLRELQELLESDIISQTEFEVMKSKVLNNSTLVDSKLDLSSNVSSNSKNKHKTRNIILIVVAALVVISGVGGALYYFSNRPEVTNKNMSSSSSTSRRSNVSQSTSTSSSSSLSSSSSNAANDQDFTSLAQKEQLALLVAWGEDKGGSVALDQIKQSSSIVADLSQPNWIVLAPNPGNMGIEIRDNHDGTFEMKVYMDGQIVGSEKRTGNDLVERYYSNEIEPNVGKIVFK